MEGKEPSPPESWSDDDSSNSDGGVTIPSKSSDPAQTPAS